METRSGKVRIETYADWLISFIEILQSEDTVYEYKCENVVLEWVVPQVLIKHTPRIIVSAQESKCIYVFHSLKKSKILTLGNTMLICFLGSFCTKSEMPIYWVDSKYIPQSEFGHAHMAEGYTTQTCCFLVCPVPLVLLFKIHQIAEIDESQMNLRWLSEQL